jgi:hypothetical protein
MQKVLLLDKHLVAIWVADCPTNGATAVRQRKSHLQIVFKNIRTKITRFTAKFDVNQTFTG